MTLPRPLSTVLLAASLAACISAVSGCRRGSASAATAEPTDVAALARNSTRPTDLSAPFNVLSWSQSGASHAPLAVAAQLATSAGGDWLAVLPTPADDVKWQPQFPEGFSGRAIVNGVLMGGSRSGQPVSACLAAILKSGTTVSWDMRDGRLLLYFGSEEALGHARAHPPETVTGIMVRAHNCAGLLASIADFWKLRIDADPALLARRDAVIAARKTTPDADEPRGILGAFSSVYRIGMGGGQIARPPSDALTLLVEEKVTPEQLLQKAASLIGGECARQGSGWRITSISDEGRRKEEIARLKQVVEEKAGTEYVHASPSPIGGESIVVIGSLGDEAQYAIESLAAMGPPAFPTLREYLTSEKASIAQGALKCLLALDDPAARQLVLNFGERLLSDKATAGKAQAARPLLLGEIVRALAANPEDNGSRWLASASRDARVPSELRSKARMALAGSGRLALLLNSKSAPGAYRLADFRLAVDPGGKPVGGEGSGAITPLATCKGMDGSVWAVFVSGRCGNPSDFWLARGSGNRWVEFLFTGKSFPKQNMGYAPWSMKPPSTGCLSIEALGLGPVERIVLGPPKGETEDSILRKLQSQLSDPKLPAKKRRQIAQQMAMRQATQWQRQMTQLQATITIDIAEARKDTDHDGLTDLVEQRLHTDPLRADTDGDGIPDGVDLNPLVPRAAKPSDRQRLVQAVFTALFAGDPNPDPIVVVMEKRDWTELTGCASPVYCITRAEYLKRMSSFSAFRVLQFGNAGGPGSTILRVDGPACYNDARTRAEVHFWQWAPRGQTANPWMAVYGMQGGGTPVDYVAIFDRRGDAWRLDTIKPWQADNADTAMGEVMKRQVEEGALQ